MAGAYAREGDMLSGHGSYPPHPFPVGGSLAAATFIEGKKVLCVDSIDSTHPGSPSPSPPIPTAKIITGSPTAKVMCSDGQLRAVARIGDSLSCGCKIMGGGTLTGGGTGG
tara:strand:- start:392 stop:724 length:333 start_codon:yes stop_codon:yes gene_type:complete